MRSKWKRFLRGGCLFFFMALGTARGASPLFLVVQTLSGTPLLTVPVRPGDTFTLSYIHSVDISPVYEVFSVDGKKGIILQRSCMRMFGAGFDPWQAHGKIVEEGGWEKMVDLNVPLGKFLLRVGAPTVDHTLTIEGMKIYLSRMIPEKRVWVMISGVSGTKTTKGR